VPAAEVEDRHAHLRVPRFQIGEVPVGPVIGVIEPVEVERSNASERGLVTKRHPRQRLAPVIAPPLAGFASGLRPGPDSRLRRSSAAMFSTVHRSHDKSKAPPK
jgi:hypothetical protein